MVSNVHHSGCYADMSSLDFVLLTERARRARLAWMLVVCRLTSWFASKSRENLGTIRSYLIERCSRAQYEREQGLYVVL